MSARADELLEAMSASAIPAGKAGPWEVVKWIHPPRCFETLTSLRRIGGEVVMSDDRQELQRHFEFLFQARGRVLINGLGLGCCLRGAVTRPEITRIDIVERDPDVIKLVAAGLPRDSRIHLHRTDAVTFAEKTNERWDFAWHDLWSDTDKGEPHLAVTHQKLFMALSGRVGWQGAWAFPRYLRRLLQNRMPHLKAYSSGSPLVSVDIGTYLRESASGC